MRIRMRCRANHLRAVKKWKMGPLEGSHFRISNIYIYVKITGPVIYHYGRKQCSRAGTPRKSRGARPGCVSFRFRGVR